MKKMVIAASALVASTLTVCGAEEAKTSTERFDEAIAATNINKIISMVSKKEIAQDVAFEKVIGKPELYQTWFAVAQIPTTNETYEAAAKDAVLALTDDLKWNPYAIENRTHLYFKKLERADQKAYAKMLNSALDAGNKMIFACYFANTWTIQKNKKDWYLPDIDPELLAAYKRVVEIASEKALAGTLPPIVYQSAIFKTTILFPGNLFDKFYNAEMFDYNDPEKYFYAGFVGVRGEVGTALRNKIISKVVAKDEAFAMKIGKIEDNEVKTKNFTEKKVYPFLKNAKNKITTALYLKDNDKLVDTLAVLDNSLDAKTLDEVIAVINTFDADYRAADVVKILKNINKKYTLKLYDDRDIWEPVLSKVRAMIDTYNN